MNYAFVFIKPHANTTATQALVSQMLTANGVNILSEDNISGAEIDSKMLIDQHYYSIASKATLLKPQDLPVPADIFENFFKISWTDALAQNKVYNALDACPYLGVDGTTKSFKFNFSLLYFTLLCFDKFKQLQRWMDCGLSARKLESLSSLVEDSIVDLLTP